MHKQLGMELKILDERWNIIFSDENNTGLTKKQIRQKVDRTIRYKRNLSKLRCFMDDLVFQEYPDEAHTGIYYGERPEDFEEVPK